MTTALYWITGEGEVGDTENDISIIAADDTTEGAHPESFEDEDDAVNENVNVMLPNSSQNSTGIYNTQELSDFGQASIKCACR